MPALNGFACKPLCCAGAIVLELLPYNWEWRGVSTLYRNITSSLGDVHHFAWRAQSAKHAAYESPDDARYGDWTHEECASTCDTIVSAADLCPLHPVAAHRVEATQRLCPACKPCQHMFCHADAHYTAWRG